MNLPKPSCFSSPLAMKPIGVKSSVVSQNVTGTNTQNDLSQPSTPRVDSAGVTSATTVKHSNGEPSTNDTKPADKVLIQAGNIRSLVFDPKDVRHDLGPPDEKNSPARVAAAGNKRKAVADEIPVLEIKKLHAFPKEQMPVYWNITNLKPNKVNRHLRCLLLAVESRPAFDQILPQYNQLRDHFDYSYVFFQKYPAASNHQARLQALYKLVFDELHSLLELADQLESTDEEDEEFDENDLEPSDSSKRPRLG